MDGMKMHQSAAIIRYLARKAGGTLYGRNEFEALQCDVAYDTISDLRVSELTRGP
jgi:glutathione S-transferase